MIETIEGFQVVRDDLLPGGTKRKALERWLPSMHADSFIYAGSVFGWGAPALSEACATLKLKCTILMSRSEYDPPWLEKVQSTPSTKLIMVKPMPVEFMKDMAAEKYADSYLLPPGFDHPGFSDAITTRAQTMQAPERAWVPVVSGTLLRALEEAWPETEFHGVCAARRHGYEGPATLHMAPEKFSQPAQNPPPYPSCTFSDAKVWQFAAALGRPGDLIWNTNP